MSDQLIIRTEDAGLRRLTLHGKEVIDSFGLLNTIIRSRLSVEHALLFARPVKHAENQIEWFTERGGLKRRVDTLNPTERANLEARYQRIHTDLRRLVETLKGEDASAILVGNMLERALHTPSDTALWDVGGEPVLATWGIVSATEAPLADPAIASRAALAPLVQAPLYKPLQSPVVATPNNVRYLPRWPLAFLLLLLVGLFFFVWKGREYLPPELSAKLAPIFDLHFVLQDCPTPTDGVKQTPLAIVFDTSGSMNIGMEVSGEELRQLDEDMRSGNMLVQMNAHLRLQALQDEAAPGTRRIDVARELLQKSLTTVDPARLVVITFPNGCEIRTDYGPNALSTIQSMPANGATPLAAALEVAAEVVHTQRQPGTKGHIMLISDGADSCGGNTCAVAQQIKLQKPDAIINVIEIGSQSGLECVASATGGIIRQATQAIDLTRILSEVVRKASGPACRPAQPK